VVINEIQTAAEENVCKL